MHIRVHSITLSINWQDYSVFLNIFIRGLAHRYHWAVAACPIQNAWLKTTPPIFSYQVRNRISTILAISYLSTDYTHDHKQPRL